MNKALRYKEPDRVPVSDWLWGSFVIQLAGYRELAPAIESVALQ